MQILIDVTTLPPAVAQPLLGHLMQGMQATQQPQPQMGQPQQAPQQTMQQPSTQQTQEPEMTLEMLQKAAIAFSQQHGNEAVVKLLSEQGASKLSDLPDSNARKVLANKMANYAPTANPLG